jgi:hypothetical protein
MKKTIVEIISISLLFIIISCSNDINPQFRVLNESAENVKVKIQTSDNKEFHINDVVRGQASEYQTASEGNITVTAIIQNESISFIATKNTRYTIVINTGKAPSLKIDK